MQVSGESTYSGQQALLMEDPVPVTFPAAAYTDPDYGKFLHSAESANGEPGGGYAEIMQTVPVIAGHLYSVRYRYRTEDFQPEHKQVGHPRGYTAFGGRIAWRCTPPNPNSVVNLGGTQETSADWQTICDWIHGWDLPHPYTAPEGAVTATILFNFVSLSEGHSPRVFLDDVEFVDVTPTMMLPK